jgi:hypothetical protein
VSLTLNENTSWGGGHWGNLREKVQMGHGTNEKVYTIRLGSFTPHAPPPL